MAIRAANFTLGSSGATITFGLFGTPPIESASACDVVAVPTGRTYALYHSGSRSNSASAVDAMNSGGICPGSFESTSTTTTSEWTVTWSNSTLSASNSTTTTETETTESYGWDGVPGSGCRSFGPDTTTSTTTTSTGGYPTVSPGANVSDFTLGGLSVYCSDTTATKSASASGTTATASLAKSVSDGYATDTISGTASAALADPDTHELALARCVQSVDAPASAWTSSFDMLGGVITVPSVEPTRASSPLINACLLSADKVQIAGGVWLAPVARGWRWSLTPAPNASCLSDITGITLSYDVVERERAWEVVAVYLPAFWSGTLAKSADTTSDEFLDLIDVGSFGSYMPVRYADKDGALSRPETWAGTVFRLGALESSIVSGESGEVGILGAKILPEADGEWPLALGAAHVIQIELLDPTPGWVVEFSMREAAANGAEIPGVTVQAVASTIEGGRNLTPHLAACFLARGYLSSTAIGIADAGLEHPLEAVAISKITAPDGAVVFATEGLTTELAVGEAMLGIASLVRVLYKTRSGGKGYLDAGDYYARKRTTSHVTWTSSASADPLNIEVPAGLAQTFDVTDVTTRLCGQIETATRTVSVGGVERSGSSIPVPALSEEGDAPIGFRLQKTRIAAAAEPTCCGPRPVAGLGAQVARETRTCVMVEEASNVWRSPHQWAMSASEETYLSIENVRWAISWAT